jgi:thioredoxin 1
MKNVINVTASNFEDIVLKSDKPVVIDFWAPWCGPCKMFAPVFEELSGEKSDVVFVKIDVEENQDLGQKCLIRSIPTLQVYSSGKLVASKIGTASKDGLNAWIDSVIE